MTQTIPESAPLLALPWIIRMRLGLALAVALCVLIARFALDVPLDWLPMLALAGLIALSNLALRAAALARRPWLETSTLVGLTFVLDILCLTALFMLSGGPTNPFSLLYLVHVTLSATILTKRWTWLLGALGALGYGLLFPLHRPVAAFGMHHHGPGPNLHVFGMWLAFLIAAFLVALFAGKISERIWVHQESLRAVQAELARKDRLAALVTLAAGAAHELGSPLATIAVVAKDLERYAGHNIEDEEVVGDCRLIRSEVDRCRAILERMSVQGAEPPGESVEEVTPAELLAGLGETVAVDWEPGVENMLLLLPKRAVRQALQALVKNAREAGGAPSGLRVAVLRRQDRLCFEVRDAGCGMTEAQLRRVGEPFFTTKPPGAGMGLGVFLVRCLAERLGATLHYESTPGAGTTAALLLPTSPKLGPRA